MVLAVCRICKLSNMQVFEYVQKMSRSDCQRVKVLPRNQHLAYCRSIIIFSA